MTTLIPSEVLGIPAPNGVPRVTLRIQLPDRTVTAEVSSKSLRKAQTAIREIGGDNVVVMLQGRFVAGDKIEEAGLSAQEGAMIQLLIRLLLNSARRLTPQPVGK
jgi:hypothetical protein